MPSYFLCVNIGVDSTQFNKDRCFQLAKKNRTEYRKEYNIE